MATVFTQDAVLHFLQSKGGSVKNSDLLLHFRNFIRNHAEQDRNRELFKKFVNSVATVRQQDSVSYVVLRRKFRGHTPGDGDGDSGGGSSGPPRLSAAENSDPCPVVTVEKHSLKLQPRQVTTAAPPGETLSKTIIPAAGIMINNIVETNLNPKQTQQQVTRASDLSGRLAAVQVASQTPSLSKPLVQDEGPELAQQRVAFCLLPADKQHGASKQVSVPQTVRGREDGLQREAPPLHPEVAPCRFRYRQSYKSAVSYDEDVEEEDEVAIRPGRAEAWPQSASLVDTGRAISTSLPCIIDTPAPPSVVSSSSSSSSERSLPKIYIRNVEEEALPPCDPGLSFESGIGLKGQWMGTRLEPMSVLAESASTRHNQPLQTACYTSTAGKAKEVSPQRNIHQDHQYSHASGVQLEPRTELCQSQTSWLSPSHSSIVSPSSDASFSSSDWPPSGSSKGSGWNSSYGDLQARAGELYHDREEAESSEGSTSAPVPWQRPAFTRRLSSQLRNRMCRSLGADLDQLPQEARGRGGSEAARLNRLHLISSSLSLHCNLSSSSLSSCSTPPRCHSLADLVQEKGGKRSLHAVTSSTTHYEGPGRQSLVPLEPKEHSWLVKGAAGAWTDVYSLFREDSSLLNKQDFISGFTVLHWIAKHGDHRVLNTLWYGVQKAGLLFDINARSTCGYTPLHIAAIHGNKNIMRLLVNKFNADVRLRDTAGKKPWQYLSSNVPVDIFQLLGAPAWAAVGGVSRVEAGWEKQQQCRRRRPHHLSSASSGERPLTIAGTMRVKRSSSIAAFLKQKSLRRFHGYQSNPLV